MRHLTARRIRHVGFWTAYWSVALAAFVENWHTSFLVGVFAIGLGVGLGDWKWGD